MSSTHGAKVKAGKLFTSFLREIAGEETELAKNPDGEEVMVSKAEAMSRKIWDMALGYTETKQEDDGAEIKIFHSPDRGMMNLLFDRLEGKIVPVGKDDAKKTKITAADKVTEQGAKRIAQAGNMDEQ